MTSINYLLGNDDFLSYEYQVKLLDYIKKSGFEYRYIRPQKNSASKLFYITYRFPNSKKYIVISCYASKKNNHNKHTDQMSYSSFYYLVKQKVFKKFILMLFLEKNNLLTDREVEILESDRSALDHSISFIKNPVLMRFNKLNLDEMFQQTIDVD